MWSEKGKLVQRVRWGGVGDDRRGGGGEGGWGGWRKGGRGTIPLLTPKTQTN